MVLITSKQNPKVKDLTKLKLKKYRDKTGKFLVEGFYPIKFALQNNYPLDELFFCPDLLRQKFDNQEIIKLCAKKGILVTELTSAVFKKISSLESPEGLVALAQQRIKCLEDYQIAEKSLEATERKSKLSGVFIVVESIEKLGNLGSIFRLADNVGAEAVIVCDMRADIFNPETIRSSVGAFFSITALKSTTNATIEWCKKNKIKTLATTPQASQVYTSVDLKHGSLAVVLGAEYSGLSKAWLENADIKILIPMFGQANSLSVTSSAAVVLYEIVRQRINL